MSPPEPIPFPSSQSDRKPSPHYGQRSTQNTGSISNKSNNSPSSMGFSQSYSSSYQSYGSQKGSSSVGLNSTTSGYTLPVSQSSSSLNSTGLQGHMSSSQSGGNTGSYGSHAVPYQSFHSQASFSTNPATNNSLYQGSANQSNYPAHQSAPTGGSAYQNQSTTYHSSRDSQPANSFQAAVSQAAAAYPGGNQGNYQTPSQTNNYQSGGSQSNNSNYPSAASHTGNSPYQRDSTSNQSTYNSSQTYGSSSSSHQGSLPLSTNKLTDSLQKMTVKENSLDTRQTTSQVS